MPEGLGATTTRRCPHAFVVLARGRLKRYQSLAHQFYWREACFFTAMSKNTPTEPVNRQIESRTDLTRDAVVEISGALRLLLADAFTLFVKTKNFHWHITGRSFRDLHLLLDEHADQILAMTDALAERSRKLGGSSLRSISDIARHQRLKDNNEEELPPATMLLELQSDSVQLTKYLRSTHEVCDRHRDVATSSLIENWIDEAERRTWFLSEIVADL
jgi:starvation-inducible DNA-binding protein